MNDELCSICEEPETDPEGLCECCECCSLCCDCGTFDTDEQEQREDEWAEGKNVN